MKKRLLCCLIAALLVFGTLGTVAGAEGQEPLSITFTGTQAPEQPGGIETALEETTVGITSTDAEATVSYSLTFFFADKGKDPKSSAVKTFQGSGSFRLLDEVLGAMDDPAVGLTQEEIEGLDVIIVDAYTGDAAQPDAQASENIMPASCQPVTFGPAAGEYSYDTEIALLCATTGAEVSYTTNGVAPGKSGTSIYDGTPLRLTKDMTLLATAAKKGLKKSAIARADYTVIKSGAVTANPAPGAVAPGTQVTLTAQGGDETVYYTLDGTDPSPDNASAQGGNKTVSLTINEDTVVTARTVKAGEGAGDVQRFPYTVTAQGDAYEPNDTPQQASAVSFPARIHATIHSPQDADYYSFEYHYSAPVELTLRQPEDGRADYTLTLLKPDGTVVAESDAKGDQKIAVTLEAGTYLALVKSPSGQAGPGEYTLTLSKKATQGLDLSEYNLLNAMLNPDAPDAYTPEGVHGGNDGVMSGGDVYMALAYLARWSGPVMEAEDPYTYLDFSGEAFDPQTWERGDGVDRDSFSYHELPASYHMQQAVMLPDRADGLDNDHYKSAIYTYGAIYCGIKEAPEFFREGDTYYYHPALSDSVPIYPSGHAISLVGWDDSIPASTFKVTIEGMDYEPQGDGAFIAKNNYGPNSGENGFFYISYYSTDLSSNPATAIFVDERADNYDSIYQYDPLGYTNAFDATEYFSEKVLYAKNTFTAEGNQSLRAVSFYATHEDQAYDVYIETQDGKKHVASGQHKYKGYYTVPLGEDIDVRAGEEFSVILRLQNSDGSNVLAAIEMPVKGRSDRATATAGQSFISADGVHWEGSDGGTDISKNYQANNCIKVFADGATQQKAAEGNTKSRAYTQNELQAIPELSAPVASAGRSGGSGENETLSLPQGGTQAPLTGAQLPARFDLRDEGAVTPARHQGSVPSCWTFATMASAESILMRRNNIADQAGVESVSIDGADSMTLEAGAQADYSAKATVTPDKPQLTGVVWSYAGDLDSIEIKTQESTGGEQAALFTAKAPGVVTVTATSAVDDTKSVSKTVTITQNAPKTSDIPGAEGKKEVLLPYTPQLDEAAMMEGIQNLAQDEVLRVPVANGTTIPAGAFTAIKGQDKTVCFEIMGEDGTVIARIVINGRDVTNPGELLFELSTQPGDAAKAAAQAFPDGTKQLFLRFGGTLPGRATVSVLAKPPFEAGESVYLYYLNGANLELQPNMPVPVLSDGWVSMVMTHWSEYVLADRQTKAADVPADVPAGGQTGGQTGGNAKTNDTRDMTPWIVVVIVAAVAAAAVLVWQWRIRRRK